MAGTQGGEWVIYLRLSRGRAGIARQRRAVTKWVEDDLGGTIVDEFKDDDRTAFQKFGGPPPARKGFDRMLGMLTSRPGLNAGAWHADRLCRNLDDAERLLTTSAGAGGVIGTPAGGIYDPRTATGRGNFRRDVVSAISEVDHMTERIVLMKTEAKEHGHWLGGPRTFGWERGPAREEGEAPSQILVPFEAGCVAAGTRAINSGASLSSVRRAWHAAGATGTKGAAFTNQEVSAILCRARNAGLAEYDPGDGSGPVVTGKGAWPAIVAEEEWRSCRAILQDPSRRTQRGTATVHLLSGIAVCGVCGTPVVATSGNRGKDRPRQVTYADRPKNEKGHVTRTAEPLDLYVSELVIAWVEKHGQEALQPPAPDVALLAGQLEAVKARLAVLEKAADDEAITDEQFVRRARPLNRRARELRDRLATAATGKTGALVFTTDDIRAGWHAADIDAQRSIVRALMDVTILPSPRGRPPGHKPGESYFRPEYVQVTWKR